ncbi:hypothetical protein ACHWQZ_G014308 [Mnemiopsis leidyi]
MLKYKINELRNSGDMERIIDTSQRLEEQYNLLNNTFSNNPCEFIKKMQHLLNEETKILRAADTAELEVKPIIGDTWMGDLQGSLFSLSFKHVNELKSRIDEQINCLDEKADFKRLSQEEMHRKTASFNARQAELTQAQRDSFKQNRDRFMRTLQGMNAQMGEVVVGLLTLFDDILRKLKVAHDYILKEIDDWKEEQRRGMISGKQPPSLDYIERDACLLADTLTSCAGYYARLQDHLEEMAENRNLITHFHSEILNFIRGLMYKCFIIEKQPPQVLKRDTKFSAAVRIIAGERWGFAIKQPLLKVYLVNAEQAQAILNSNGDVRDVQVCGDVVNGEKVMDYSTQTKTVHCHLKNMVVKKLSRAADRRAAELVTEEKFGVYFQCLVHVPYKESYSPHPHSSRADSKKTLPAVSLPVTVTVHGSQSSAAEATIFWDNSFAPRNRDSFAHPGAQPWGELKARISDCFMKNTDRYLNEDALRYLGMKVLNLDSADDLDSKPVSWQAFSKDTLKKPDRTFTFWEWLYSCIDLIKKHFLPMWKDNLIEGFISKARTEALLKSAEPHTFLLRFSDSNQGMISISLKQRDESIKHIIYSAAELKRLDLAQRILDPDVLRYLYPHHPKEMKFKKYYKAVKEEVPGYEKDFIRAHIPLEQVDIMKLDNLFNEPESANENELMEIISYFDSY